MGKKEKLLKKLLSDSKSIRFDEMVTLAGAFGFQLSRVRGSHHIFEHPKIPEIINLQNVSGQAKSYQIRQFLAIVEKHNLTLEDREE
jgi:predicted RNA binding protein YcfA (HicA-like mRNA interferase family)